MKHKKRFFKGTRQHYFLFGPRGTGKSTWLQRHYGDAVWIDLLDPLQFRTYEARPERLESTLPKTNLSSVVVIDEIQRVPELLSVVHKTIEQRSDLQFVLTGSSARKLKTTGANLLGGRAATMKMNPFMASELGDDFNLTESLSLGMVPVVRGATEPRQSLNGYVDVYLRQEIQAEAMVRRIDSFTRFLESISFSQGAVLNLSDVARDCQVKRSTVTGFVQILEDLLIADVLPVFSRRAKRNLVSHNKFYFFDCGVFRSLRPTGPLDSPAEIDGAALETLVYQHLQAWVAYSDAPSKLYFWRTQAGSEVDFIVYGEAGFFAIEVKNAATVRPRDVRALRTFREDYPDATPLLLYRGKERMNVRGVDCMPVESFLKKLKPNNPIVG